MNLLILRSSFQTDAFVEKEYATLLDSLMSEFQADITILGDDEKAIQQWIQSGICPDFVMTATGGVEGLFKQIIGQLGENITLIADGRNNSLAAALEILSYLSNEGRKGRIIHGSNTEIIAEIKNETKPFSGTRIGCFGEPSDWLIASGVDRDYVFKRYGIQIVDIDLQHLIDGIKTANQAEATKIAQACMKRSKAIVEPSCADMIEAAKTYLAIKQICTEEQLTAVSIRCFDIVNACNTTSCLALAMLNDEGIVAGCEGDLQTVITMVLAQKICGEKAFMANPSILTEQSSLLAHCTLPLSMCDEIVMRSHFESLKGVAIQGLLPTTDYTLLKWGGAKMDKFFVTEAKALPLDYSDHFCRTQIKLDVNLKDYLLNHSIGNHQVIIKGRHAEAIRNFMKGFNCQEQ